MKNKKLFLIIVVIMFVLTMSLSYAYFSLVLTNENGPHNIVTETGTLRLTYTDGPEINAINIKPGWTKTKTITVENTGSLDAYYKINWYSLNNEILEDEMVISATCSSTIGTCEDIAEIPVGYTAGDITSNVEIRSSAVHTYVVLLNFKETSSVQNYNQGKSFNGVLNIEDSVKAFTLKGKLLNESSLPIVGATVEVHSEVKTAVTDVRGEFTIRGVEVGITNNTSPTLNELDNEISYHNYSRPKYGSGKGDYETLVLRVTKKISRKDFLFRSRAQQFPDTPQDDLRQTVNYELYYLNVDTENIPIEYELE